MLVAVIMMFLALSFTGVSVLNVSYLSRSASAETIENIKLQYQMESRINQALWQINTGVDSLVGDTATNVNCSWNPEEDLLTINIQQYGMETEVMLDLSEDTPFNRGLASNNPINTYGYDIELAEKHRIRTFKLLPDVDLSYFQDKAVVVHHGNQASWKEADLALEGIHIFTTSNVNISDLTLNNSTLVFTGRGITFNGINHVRAPLPADSSDAQPVLVFTDSDVSVTLAVGNQFEGAIYCAGQIVLNNPILTGPVIAESIYLNHNQEFLDDEFSEYYRWTAGFGQRSNYNWPKQINRWKNTIWERKPSSKI